MRAARRRNRLSPGLLRLLHRCRKRWSFGAIPARPARRSPAHQSSVMLIKSSEHRTSLPAHARARARPLAAPAGKFPCKVPAFLFIRGPGAAACNITIQLGRPHRSQPSLAARARELRSDAQQPAPSRPPDRGPVAAALSARVALWSRPADSCSEPHHTARLVVLEHVLHLLLHRSPVAAGRSLRSHIEARPGARLATVRHASSAASNPGARREVTARQRLDPGAIRSDPPAICRCGR